MNRLSLGDFFSALNALNYIRIAVIVLLIHVLGKVQGRPASSGHVVAWHTGLAIMTVLAVAGSANTGALAVLCALSVILWRFFRRDESWLSAQILLVALAVNTFVAPLLFHLFSEQILRLDTVVAYGFSWLFDPGAVMEGTRLRRGSGFSIMLVGACSSFNALSMATLAYLGYVIHRRGLPRRPDYFWLLAMMLAMVLCNVLRLMAMSAGSAAYGFWHGSHAGVFVISLCTHLCIIGMCLLGEKTCRG